MTRSLPENQTTQERRTQGKIHPLREALEKEAAGAERRPPRDLDHQPGHPQTGEPQSLQPQNGTEVERRFQFRAAACYANYSSSSMSSTTYAQKSRKVKSQLRLWVEDNQSRTRFLLPCKRKLHLVHVFLISHTISFENPKTESQELSFSSSKTS